MYLQKITSLMRRKKTKTRWAPGNSEESWVVILVVKLKDCISRKKQKLPDMPILSVLQSQSTFFYHEVCLHLLHSEVPFTDPFISITCRGLNLVNYQSLGFSAFPCSLFLVKRE